MEEMLPRRHSYMRDELQNILLALHTASGLTAQNATRVDSDDYLAGFHDALQSVAIALGLVSEFDGGYATSRHSMREVGRVRPRRSD